MIKNVKDFVLVLKKMSRNCKKLGSLAEVTSGDQIKSSNLLCALEIGIINLKSNYNDLTLIVTPQVPILPK